MYLRLSAQRVIPSPTHAQRHIHVHVREATASGSCKWKNVAHLHRSTSMLISHLLKLTSALLLQNLNAHSICHISPPVSSSSYLLSYPHTQAPHPHPHTHTYPHTVVKLLILTPGTTSRCGSRHPPSPSPPFLNSNPCRVEPPSPPSTAFFFLHFHLHARANPLPPGPWL